MQSSEACAAELGCLAVEHSDRGSVQLSLAVQTKRRIRESQVRLIPDAGLSLTEGTAMDIMHPCHSV